MSGQQDKLFSGEFVQGFGVPDVSIPVLTPEEEARRLAPMYKSRWADPEYGVVESQAPSSKGPAKAAKPELQRYQAPAGKSTAATTLQDPKGKGLAVPQQRLDSQSAKGQQIGQKPTTPAGDAASGGEEATKKKRRQRGGKGRNKNKQAADTATSQSQGQGTPKPTQRGPGQESTGKGADKNQQSAAPGSSKAPQKAIASQQKPVDSKPAQPTPTRSPAVAQKTPQPQQQQHRQQQQGEVRGNQSVPRVGVSTGANIQVGGTPTPGRSSVQGSFGSPAARTAVSSPVTGTGGRSTPAEQSVAGSSTAATANSGPKFAIAGQNTSDAWGWNPSTSGDMRASTLRRRRPGTQPELAPKWGNYWNTIQMADKIQDIYANDKLDMNAFNSYVARQDTPAEEKVQYLSQMVQSMDRIIDGRHNAAEAISKERNEFHADLQRAQAQADEYAKKLAAADPQREQLQLQIDNLRQTVDKMTKEMSTKELYINSAEHEITRLTNDLQLSSSSLNAVLQQKADQRQEAANQSGQIIDLHGEVKSMSEELQGLRTKVQSLNSERKRMMEEMAASRPMQAEVDELRDQLAWAKDQLTTVRQVLRELGRDYDAVCEQLRESSDPTSISLYAELMGSGELQSTGSMNARDSSCQTSSASLVSVTVQTAEIVGVSASTQTAELVVSSQEASTQTEERKVAEASTQTVEVGVSVMEASTQTEEREVSEASTQTVEVGVSVAEAATQTIYSGEVREASTQTEMVEKVVVPTREASTQTVLVGDVLSLAEVEVREGSVRQTKDIGVQTEAQVAVVPESSMWWKVLIFLFLLLIWAAIMYYSRQMGVRAWEDANDLSRVTAYGIQYQSSGLPWWLASSQRDFAMMLHIDRVLLG
ncbi:hypothetical protein FQN57_006570 [Myotisia sp. PD_48]|nr:hypothetical protein FQN57_006570 [Myotisia sp. PD_48]